MSRNVLVLGAGELGMAVSQALAAHANAKEAQINVLVRPSTLAANAPHLAMLRSAGIALVEGDPVSLAPAALSDLLRPYDTVIGCLGFVAPPNERIQVKIAEAVLAAGVGRFIPWQFGLDYDEVGRGSAQPLFDEQLDVRALLRGQATTEWIIVQTGVFTSFLFEPWWGVVEQDADLITVRAFGSWAVGITATAAKDIAQSVAALLLEQGEWARYAPGKCNLAGDTVNYAELAAIIEKVAESRGKTVRREVWAVSKLMDELATDPDNQIKRYRPVFASGRGTAFDKASSYNTLRGFESLGLEDYARSIIQ